MPAESTKEKALKALDGMAEVVKNEMLVHNTYVSDTVVDPVLAEKGAICHGHAACAIGSLWLGARVRMELDCECQGIKYWEMPGTAPSEREEFVARRPGLRLALDALNEEAHKYGERHGLITHSLIGRSGGITYVAGIEALFERNPYEVGRKQLLQVINNAKRKVRAA